jgi:hypothetical protein
MHGTAYAYGRAGSWDARNYFNTVPNPEPALSVKQFGASFGAPIKKDKLFYFVNYEGQRYDVGNPVIHTVPITGGAAATSDAKFGLIGACQAVSAANRRALSLQLAGLDASCNQLSNYPGLFPVNNTGTRSLSTALVTSNNIDGGLGKVDYHVNEKHSLSGMYFFSQGDGVFVDNPTLEVAPQWLTNQHARAQVGSGSWTWTPTSRWVNQFRLGYSRYTQAFFSNDHNQDPANYSLNGSTYHIFTGQTDALKFGLPVIQWQGGYTFQLGLGWPKLVGPDAVWDISDSASVLRGNHAFKFGGEVLILQSTNNVTANTKGNARFGNTRGGPPALQNFFGGNMNRAQFTAGNLLRHLKNEGIGVFLQDDWRISPRFTLNAGLRYEVNTVVQEANNLEGNFDPTRGLVQVGSGISAPFNGDHNNVAPRLGLAWDVFGNGKTVIRAGAGIYYEQGSYDALMALGNLLGLRTIPTGAAICVNKCTATTTAGGTINVGQVTLTGGQLGTVGTAGTVKDSWAKNSATTTLYNVTPACGDGSTLPGSVQKANPCVIMGVDANLRTPYVSTWMLDVQRAITSNLSLDVAYVGNHGTKLVGLIDLNQPPIGAGWGNPAAGTGTGLAATGSPAYVCLNDFASNGPYGNCAPDGGLEQKARPFNGKFPFLSYINWLSNNNFSNYNALQVSATQRSSHGLSFVLGYTYSHALGESPDNWRFTSPVNAQNVRSLYGNSEFDITHRFTTSLTYAIPGLKTPGQFLQGWSINSIVSLQSGLPWGVNDTANDFSGAAAINAQGTIGETWDFYGNPADFKTTKALINTNNGDGGIPFFAGSSNSTCLAKAQALDGGASTGLAQAALANLGCYVMGNSVLIPPAFGSLGTLGRNPFRSTPFYNWDFSVTKAIKFKERLSAQFRAEFFNVLNHPNISNPYGGPGGGNDFTGNSIGSSGSAFGFRNETPDVTSSNPVLGSGGPRAIQLGLKFIF